MDIEVCEKTVTSFECVVRVDQVFLTFQEVNGKIWKIAAFTYESDISHLVPKLAFLEARRQASCAIRSRQRQEHAFAKRQETFEVTSEVANAALAWGKRYARGAEPWEVINEWLVMTGRWTQEREKKMRSIAGKMGGHASATTQRSRAAHERAARVRKQQLRLNL